MYFSIISRGKTIAAVIVMVFSAALMSAKAKTYSHKFDNTPVSQALLNLAKDNSKLNIAFIYKELDMYRTSAQVDTDDAMQAIKAVLGNNPISLIRKDNMFFIEALQHGRFTYSGITVDRDHQPLPGATILLLNNRDSTVITFGVTDVDGRFSIPCDKKKVLAKVSCVGYTTTYRQCDTYNVGTIVVDDSPIALKALKVEGRNTMLYPDKDSYIPSQRQKKYSQTGFDLLRHMSIPSLQLEPGTETVTDVFGTKCELFINYVPAGSDDLTGLRVADVRRVEILDNPTDPRFRGASKAINFIVQEYDYGGYTKLSASETTLNGFTNKASVFSKFTYRKMTFDFFAGANNSRNHHTGANNLAQYTIGSQTVDRSENITQAKEATDGYPLSFRATYSSRRLQVRNLVSFTHSAMPQKYQSGNLDYNSRNDLGYGYIRDNTSRDNRFQYTGNIYWVHPSDFAIDYTQQILHTHRKTASLFVNNALSQAIDNKAIEDVTNLSFSAYGLKALGSKHRLRAGAQFMHFYNKINYRNTNNSIQDLKISTVNANVQYTLTSKRLNLSASMGLGHERSDINGYINHTTSPYGKLNFSYKINDKNRISANGYISVWTPGISMRQDAVVRSDEFMYLTGNPLLENYKQLMANASYNWVPSNTFSFAGFTGYTEYFNRIATVYTPYNNGNSLLRSFVNDGNYINYYAGVSGNLKLLSNSLQLYANVTQNMYNTTGIYNRTLWPVVLQFSATYYWKSFYAMAAWVKGTTKLTENSNITITGKNNYLVEAGWGNDSWNVKLTATKFLDTGWDGDRWERISPLYTEVQTYQSPWAHANVNISVTYTIGYGKKVRRNNEIGAQGGGSSSIMVP